jgi:hypothetical protein
MGFNVTCSPGKEAAAGFVRVTSELPALVIYLDPVNVAIQLPPYPGGDAVLVKFCRELAREAAKLADAVEQKRVQSAPRHLGPVERPEGDPR